MTQLTLQIIIITLIFLQVTYIAIKAGVLKKVINWYTKITSKSDLTLQSFKVLPKDVTSMHVIVLNLSLFGLCFVLADLIKINFVLLFILLIGIEVAILWFIKHSEGPTDISKELPNILYIFARTYKISLDLKDCVIAVIKNNKSAIVKSDFTEILNQINLGLSHVTAIENVLNKYNDPKISTFINLLKLSKKTGIDLPKMLTKVAQIIEKNARNKKDAHNVMFQTKTSSIASSLIVPAILIMLLIMSKSYFDVLIVSKSGKLILVACSIWYLIGIYSVSKILKDASFKV